MKIKRKKISELGEVITGKTPSKNFSKPFGDKLQFFTPSDIQNQRYLDKTQRCLSEESIEKLNKYVLPKNTILVTCIGSDMGKVCITRSEGISNQQINAIIPNKENDYLFIYYLLKTKKNYLRNYASGGSTMPIINKNDFSNLEFNIPPLPTQIKISSFFSSLDEKIELNQKMNETLEEIAKTLFKSWFIDFDPVRDKVEGRPKRLSKEISDLFPDSFEDSELGEIPEGWSVEPLSNVTSFKNGFAFKSKDWTESGNPVVKIGNVKPLIIDIDGCSFISDEVEKYDEYLLSKGDILIGMTGYVGETCLVPGLEKMPYQNQRVGKLIPAKDFFKEFLFSFTRQSEFKKKIEEIAQGSAQQNVSGKDILRIQFAFGNERILKMFSESTSDIFNKILLNFEENVTLVKLRDTLLPKLMSGELKVPEAESLINEVSI